jgi:hypothetical protein
MVGLLIYFSRFPSQVESPSEMGGFRAFGQFAGRKRDLRADSGGQVGTGSCYHTALI